MAGSSSTWMGTSVGEQRRAAGVAMRRCRRRGAFASHAHSLTYLFTRHASTPTRRCTVADPNPSFITNAKRGPRLPLMTDDAEPRWGQWCNARDGVCVVVSFRNCRRGSTVGPNSGISLLSLSRLSLPLSLSPKLSREKATSTT